MKFRTFERFGLVPRLFALNSRILKPDAEFAPLLTFSFTISQNKKPKVAVCARK
jgi:hypothetical protein